jgi:hypothetical protein
MGFFNRKKNTPTNEEALPQLQPLQTLPLDITYKPDQTVDKLRPCYVKGCRALFHRWINNAHPVLPRGTELNEKNRYYQFRRTEALVEYEDGTVERVYPTAVRFADGGQFDSFTWLPAEEAEADQQNENT